MLPAQGLGTRLVPAAREMGGFIPRQGEAPLCRDSNLPCERPGAAATKGHTLGGFKHSPGGKGAETEVWAVLCSL